MSALEPAGPDLTTLALLYANGELDGSQERGQHQRGDDEQQTHDPTPTTKRARDLAAPGPFALIRARSGR